MSLTRSQVAAACAALGLNVDRVRQVVVSPYVVSVALYRLDGDGRRVVDGKGKTVTESKQFRIVDDPSPAPTVVEIVDVVDEEEEVL